MLHNCIIDDEIGQKRLYLAVVLMASGKDWSVPGKIRLQGIDQVGSGFPGGRN